MFSISNNFWRTGTDTRGTPVRWLVLAVIATLLVWLPASAPARAAHKSQASTPTRLWYRVAFFGSIELLSSGYGDGNCHAIDCVEPPDQKPGLLAGTGYDENKTIFNGLSKGAVILTKDADGTLHTAALLSGYWSYSEHGWSNYVNSCSGGEVKQTPQPLLGKLGGQLSVSFSPPRPPAGRRKRARRQPAPSWPPQAVSIGLYQTLSAYDDFTYTPVYCEVENQTLRFGPDGETHENSQGFGFPFWCDARSEVRGKVRFEHSFLIKKQCELYTGDPGGAQSTTRVRIGVYFQLCPRGGRAGTPCRVRPTRRPWPPQSTF